MDAKEAMFLVVGDKVRSVFLSQVGIITEFGHGYRKDDIHLLRGDNTGNGAFVTYPGWRCSIFERYEDLELLV